MRIAFGFMTLAGLLFAAFLTIHHGLSAVGGVLEAAGWGLLVITLFHVVQITFSALGWQRSLDPACKVGLPLLIAARWIREAINSTLPVAQIGGEVVGARLLVLRGFPANIATASVVVDITYEFVTQFLFTLIGALLYFISGARSAFDEWMALGLVATVPMVLALVIAQRRGFFDHVERFLNWLAGHLPIALPGRMEGLHESIQKLYVDPGKILSGCFWHLMSWMAGAVEIWLILYFIGIPIGLTEALIMESLGQAVRTAAFLVPGALGVQEGGYLLLGSLFGLAPEVGLGISLAKRVREYFLGILGLLTWQVIEGGRLLGSRKQSASK